MQTHTYVYMNVHAHKHTCSVCPRCGVASSGQVSCCGRGGAWQGACGPRGSAEFEHTWGDGVKACETTSPRPTPATRPSTTAPPPTSRTRGCTDTSCATTKFCLFCTSCASCHEGCRLRYIGIDHCIDPGTCTPSCVPVPSQSYRNLYARAQVLMNSFMAINHS